MVKLVKHTVKKHRLGSVLIHILHGGRISYAQLDLADWISNKLRTFNIGLKTVDIEALLGNSDLPLTANVSATMSIYLRDSDLCVRQTTNSFIIWKTWVMRLLNSQNRVLVTCRVLVALIQLRWTRSCDSSTRRDLVYNVWIRERMFVMTSSDYVLLSSRRYGKFMFRYLQTEFLSLHSNLWTALGISYGSRTWAYCSSQCWNDLERV